MRSHLLAAFPATRRVADLAAEQSLSVKHQAEAIQYRTLDRDYWN